MSAGAAKEQGISEISASPGYPDNEIKNWISDEPWPAFLKYSINVLFAGSTAALLALRLLAPEQNGRMLGPLLLFAVALTASLLLRRGWTEATKYVLAFGSWGVATAVAIFTGGVNAPVVGAFPAIILIAAWMSNTRTAQVIGTLTVLLTIALATAESMHLLPTYFPSSPAIRGGDQIVIYIVSTLFAVFLVRAYHQHLAQLRQLGQDLAARTRDLEASKLELTQAQAVAKAGSWVYNMVTNTMHLSAETCRIFSLPEGTHGNYFEYLKRVHPDDRLATEAAWKTALRSGSFDHEHRIQVGTKFRWIREKGELSFAASGVAIRAVGITQDITERKQTEHALHVRDERFHTLFNRASEGILILTPDGTVVAANESFARMHGYAPQEMRQLNLRDLDTPDTVRLLAQRLQRILAGETLTFEVEHYHKDGHVVPLEVTSSLIVSEGERLIQAFHRDISERRRAQEAQRIAATAFEAQQGMFITDAQRVILRINQAFTEITGYSAEEAVGQTPRLLGSGRHDAAFFAGITQDLQQQGAWQGEIWNRRKGGEIYPEWLNISAVRDDAGQTSHYVAIFADISERKKAEERIKHLAFYDPLTELPNRRLLLDRLTQALAGGARHMQRGALLFVDLDNFKALNDTLGHSEGDALLGQVAARLLACVRSGDTVARLGGDEFVVLLEDLSQSELEAATQTEILAQKIQGALNQDYPLVHGPYHSSASIGITLLGSGPGDSGEEPLKRAELAMYQAKTAGRNTIRFFDPQMQVEVTNRVTLENDLREAIALGQFMLYYQPQVLGAGRVIGVEALVRWQHPRRGLVLPAQFITLAEESGLILPLGQWILETACNQLAQWARQPAMAHLSMAVNVSARQFRQANFVEQVQAVLTRSGARPNQLKLELTESMLVSDVESVIAKMSALRDIGVRFSLDDFGTGYSSLAYLKRLPLDQVKIDQGFVHDILLDTDDAAIAKMVIALADSLGLTVIAEGVETAAQHDFLAALGCHQYQGYLIGNPLPPQQLETLAQRW